MIRKGQKSDAQAIAVLLLIILKDMELPILEQMNEETLLQLLEAGIQHETYRYSYNHVLVAEIEGEVVGALVGYPGVKEVSIDAPIKDIAATLNLPLPDSFFIEKETFKGEWYIDMLVTKEGFRGRGIGKELLAAASTFALESKETILGLNCDQSNPKAEKLYKQLGFKKTSEMIISGHHYNHMQKNI